MGYIKGAMIGGIIGAAGAMMLLNYYEPRSARALMRKGKGALRHASRRVIGHHW